MTWDVVKCEFNQWTNNINETVVENWSNIDYALEIADMYNATVPKYKRTTYTVRSSK